MCRVIVDVCNPSAENALQYGFITCVSSSSSRGLLWNLGHSSSFVIARGVPGYSHLQSLGYILVRWGKKKHVVKSSDNKPRDSVTKSFPVHTHTHVEKILAKHLLYCASRPHLFFLGVSAPLCQFRMRINLGCWPGYQGTAIPITAGTIFYANNSSFY